MDVQIDRNRSIPTQIVEDLRSRITDSRLAPGDPLPSTRILARELGYRAAASSAPMNSSPARVSLWPALAAPEWTLRFRCPLRHPYAVVPAPAASPCRAI